ncbi:MAG: hypothetical protein A3F72_08135 [Bacteroidetes bacterium RIFCSPLOWO2_12_FULL_35_15]|nr:MAG: hypothetical protein A3F72_08135 [Bacteroidetes bacterium RIFCSPLOWO2_12_FULL_35_15]
MKKNKSVRIIDNNEFVTKRKKTVEQILQLNKDLENNLLQLKISEEQLQTIFRSAPEAVVVIDEEGIIVKWNPKAEAIFGWTAAEVIGKNLHEVIIPERFREAHQKGFKHFMETKEGPVLNKLRELPALRKNNTEFDAGISISPMLLKSKYFLIGFISDITEQKLIEKKLIEYKHFFNHTADFACIANMQGYFEILNPNFEKILGYSEKELLKHQFVNLVHPDDLDSTLKEIEKLKTGAITLNFTNRYRQKEGSYLWFNWNITPEPVTGKLYAIARDITGQKKIEDALKQKSEELVHINNELEQFVYMASHDLQEPLRTISSFVELIDEQYSEKLDNDANQYLQFIVTATSKMQNLIKDLLDYSKVARNITFAIVDCNNILKEVIAEMGASIKESNAKITYAILPILKGNDIKLKQLFQNLLSNAIKFRKKNTTPEIKITVEEKDNEYLFCIKDNGIGIDEQYFEKLFIIFQRLNNASDYPGTGIGLATCKKIVALHNGKIWLKSKLGEGSTFYFTISKENLNK